MSRELVAGGAVMAAGLLGCYVFGGLKGLSFGVLVCAVVVLGWRRG